MKSTQLAIVNGRALTEKEFSSSIHETIVELHQTGDIDKATHILGLLEKLGDVVGHAKAKLLYGMADWWTTTGQSDKRGIEFVDYIEGEGILKKTSIDRYLVVQGCIEDLSIPKEFHNRPMRELVPIAKALEQGYDIPKRVWDELKITDDQSDVNRVIREKVKKKPARKNAMQFVLDRDGTLSVYKGNDKRYVGYLVIDEDNLTQAAVNRILDAIGAKRK